MKVREKSESVRIWKNKYKVVKNIKRFIRMTDDPNKDLSVNYKRKKTVY